MSSLNTLHLLPPWILSQLGFDRGGYPHGLLNEESVDLSENLPTGQPNLAPGPYATIEKNGSPDTSGTHRRWQVDSTDWRFHHQSVIVRLRDPNEGVDWKRWLKPLAQ